MGINRSNATAALWEDSPVADAPDVFILYLASDSQVNILFRLYSGNKEERVCPAP